MILVDTSVWIDFFRGMDTPFRHVLHELLAGEEDICISGIILTEILQGIKDDASNAEAKDYLLDFPLYNPAGIETYIEAAGIYRRCARSGKTVRKTIDSLIAAVAIENDLTLLHNDGDFDRIEECTELKVLL